MSYHCRKGGRPLSSTSRWESRVGRRWWSNSGLQNRFAPARCKLRCGSDSHNLILGKPRRSAMKLVRPARECTVGCESPKGVSTLVDGNPESVDGGGVTQDSGIEFGPARGKLRCGSDSHKILGKPGRSPMKLARPARESTVGCESPKGSVNAVVPWFQTSVSLRSWQQERWNK